MREFKGTKGEWGINSANKQEVISYNSANIANCSGSIIITSEEKEANAKLIAASPELLEVANEVIRLRDLIEYDESIISPFNVDEASAILIMLQKCELAIKKATE